MILVLMDRLVFWADIAKLDSKVLDHLSSTGSYDEIAMMIYHQQ